jgi:hypothetical protein
VVRLHELFAELGEAAVDDAGEGRIDLARDGVARHAFQCGVLGETVGTLVEEAILQRILWQENTKS